MGRMFTKRELPLERNLPCSLQTVMRLVPAMADLGAQQRKLGELPLQHSGQTAGLSKGGASLLRGFEIIQEPELLPAQARAPAWQKAVEGLEVVAVLLGAPGRTGPLALAVQVDVAVEILAL